MYTELTLDGFIEEFRKYNREDNFSIAGLEALYNYLDGDEDFYILDVIYVCETFTEYKNLDEFWGEYDKEEYPTLEDIRDNTTVVDIEDSESFITICF